MVQTTRPITGPTTILMCVFPKVLIIIMFMRGAKLALGGGADPKKNFTLCAKTEPRSARYTYTFYISPPPHEQNPEYAPVKNNHIKYF